MTRGKTSWARRRRTPILVAAAVAVLAIAIFAAAVLGSDRGKRVATPGTTTTAQPSAADVSVNPTREDPPEHVTPVTVNVDTGWAGTTMQHFSMTFQADSLLQVTSHDSDAELPERATSSDGTPLGYVRIAPSRPGTSNTMDTGGSYLYGVVGPTVERIAIMANDAKDSSPGGSTRSANQSGDLLWVVAGTGGFGSPGNQGARIIWTPIADGWRGFAVQAPLPSPVLTVLAWNGERQLLQMRRYTPGGGAHDLPLDEAPNLPVWDPQKPAPRFGPGGPNGAEGPFVATYRDIPDQPAHDVLLEGVLGVQDGCVVLRTDDDAITPLFPQSQIESASPPAILVFRGQKYHDGDELSVGGSEITQPANLDLGICPTRVWAVSPYH